MKRRLLLLGYVPGTRHMTIGVEGHVTGKEVSEVILDLLEIALHPGLDGNHGLEEKMASVSQCHYVWCVGVGDAASEYARLGRLQSNTTYLGHFWLFFLFGLFILPFGICLDFFESFFFFFLFFVSYQQVSSVSPCCGYLSR